MIPISENTLVRYCSRRSFHQVSRMLLLYFRLGRAIRVFGRV